MKSITRKGDIKTELELCFQKSDSKNIDDFISELSQRLLIAKIKFPLLEFAASEIYDRFDNENHLDLCAKISALHTIGGNVLIGIILQKRLNNHFEECFQKAAEYIEEGAEWYVTDIIGERVFGVSLLTNFNKTLHEMKKLSRHKSNWVVRSIGPGAHYAIKKGLDANAAEKLFELLLSLSTATDFHIKTGIGWAAKTTAKFHPEIIRKFENEIRHDSVGPWFRTKIKIGLERNAYVKTRRSKNNSK